MDWFLELSESMQGTVLFVAFLVLCGIYKLVVLWIKRAHPIPDDAADAADDDDD